jgi:hypothetical protein
MVQSTPAADDIFARRTPLTIAIEIPAAGMETLRRGRSVVSVLSAFGLGGGDKASTEATVIEDGRQYTRVSVHLKGYSSFQPIDAFPSLTFNFDKVVQKQSFYGLDKISLNNSSQDTTRLNEVFARELFAAAGVPVPRATFARVALNGRDLGLYVLTEGFEKRFLGRYFKRTDGSFYEGGFVTDITDPVQVLSGKNADTDDIVQRLVRAAREADPAQRFRAISAVLDIDRFLSMVAIETLLCHSDSYSMNKNNYRLYHDPESGKVVFMPHGMDRILGAHRSALDLSLVVPRLGLVARALLSTPEGRRLYIDRVAVLVKTLFQPDALCRRANDVAVRGGVSDRDAAAFCSKLTRRAAEVAFQLTDTTWLNTVTPVAEFDSSGAARLTGWRPLPKLGQPAVSIASEKHDGAELLHLHASSPLLTSVRARIALPAGTYRVTGEIRARVGGALAPERTLPVTMIRVTPDRFNYTQQSLGTWIGSALQVPGSVSPEEIEFACEVQTEASDVWLDVSSLTIRRVN